MPNWITTDEAVDMSGYHIEYMRRLIRCGKVEAVKKGGSWWVDCDGLKAFLREAAESDDGRRGNRAKASRRQSWCSSTTPIPTP